MKKTSSTLIIVIILIILAPLVGYFGTKYILLSLDKSPEQPIVEEPIDQEPNIETPTTEVPNENTSNNEEPIEQESGVTVKTVDLKQKTISMVQLASLSSSSNADAFIKEALSKNVSSFKIMKDGLYKVGSSGYFDNENLSASLEYARETYKDAFITTVTLPKKTIKIGSEENINTDLLQKTIDEYFSLLKYFDDYATAIATQTDVNEVKSKITTALNPLLERDVFIGNFGEDFKEILNETEQLTLNNNTNFVTFNTDYINLLQNILKLYN